MRTNKFSTFSVAAAVFISAGLATNTLAGEPVRGETPKPQNSAGEARPMNADQFVELMGRQMRQIAMGAVDQIHTIAARARNRSNVPGDAPSGELVDPRARALAAVDQIGSRAKGAIDEQVSRLRSQLVGKDLPAGVLDRVDQRGAEARSMIDEAMSLARRIISQAQAGSTPATGRSDAPKSGAGDRPKAESPKADRPQSDRPKADAPKPDAPKGDRGAGESKKPEKPAASKAGSDRPRSETGKPEAPKSDKPKATSDGEQKRRA